MHTFKALCNASYTLLARPRDGWNSNMQTYLRAGLRQKSIHSKVLIHACVIRKQNKFKTTRFKLNTKIYLLCGCKKNSPLALKFGFLYVCVFLRLATVPLQRLLYCKSDMVREGAPVIEENRNKLVCSVQSQIPDYLNYGKDKKVAYEAQQSASLIFLPLLVTYGNLESIYFLSYQSKMLKWL